MQTLIAGFKKFIREEALCVPDDHILLAVSGGVDSMVMADLFLKANYTVAMAHCNFRLRGAESDSDEAFVRSFAAERDIPLFVESFDTEEYANNQKISLQMAARELRYEWFSRISRDHGFDAIAVAHNLDDVAETVLLNLARGTGLKGLTGIAPKRDRIIRPLLFASREQIMEWARDHNINFREDSSNRLGKYLRNKIRHEILPLFREINPSFLSSLRETTIRLRGIEQFFYHYIEQNRGIFIQKFGDRYVIPIAKLMDSESREAILFELLRPFHFPPQVTFEILEALEASPGKKFFSSSHRLIKDREHLIITPIKDEDKSERYYIDAEIPVITKPLVMHFTRMTRDSGFILKPDRNVAYLDSDKIHFPLILRKWRDGDWFIPLGMNGIKKLSDFFIDRKLSIDEKEAVWLLTQGDEIIWVIGMQIDERFKITPSTKEILKVEMGK